MKVFILASVLCMLFASCYSAPAEGLDILPEEGPASDNAVEVNNVMEPVMPKAEAADPEVQSAPAAVEMSEDVAVAEEDPAHPETMAFCPTGWLPHGHSCFKLVASDRWSTAEENCAALDGDLAGAGTMEDYNDLHTLAQFFGHTYYWIGGFHFQGVWRWIDGSRFRYNNWHSQNSASSYPCIALRSAGGWVNTNCGYTYPAICVKRAC